MNTPSHENKLPEIVHTYIDTLVKAIRYRKKVRQEVSEELIAHFEDALRDCATQEEKEKRGAELIESFGDSKLVAVLIRRGKKRCRPLWQKAIVRGLQGIGIVIVLFILYTGWFLTGQPKPSVDYLAKWNEVNYPEIHKEDNAWPYYKRAAESLVKPPEEFKDIFNSFSNGTTRLSDLSELQRQQLDTFLDENEAAWSHFLEGSRKPYFQREYTYPEEEDDRQLIYILLPYLGDLRDIARIGAVQAAYHADAGELEAAMEIGISIVRAGRHLQGRGTLIEQLVGIAITAIGRQQILRYSAEAPDVLLRQMQRELTSLNKEGFPEMDMRGERYMLLDTIQHIFTSSGPGGGHLVPRELSVLGDDLQMNLFRDTEALYPAALVGFSMLHAGREDTVAMALKVHRQLEEYIQLTPFERHCRGVTEDEYIKQISSVRYGLIRMFTPAIGRVADLHFRARCSYESTLAILAIQRYRLDQGKYPESLDVLFSKGYLESLPMDPYSDGPVMYRRTEEGFTLYSVAGDFEDNGGVQARTDEGKKKSWGDRDISGDEVFWPVE